MAKYIRLKDGTFKKVEENEEKWKKNKDGTFSKVTAPIKEEKKSKKKETTSQYKTKEAEEKAMQKAMFDTLFSKGTDKKGNLLGLSWDEVQEAKKKYSSDSAEFDYLSKYTNFATLQDFDKALQQERLPFQYNGQRLSQEEVIKNGYKVQAPTPFKTDQLIAQNILNPKNAFSMPAQNGIQDLSSLFRQQPTEPKYVTNAKINTEYIDELETAKNKRALDNKFDYYKHYMDEKDFKKKSAYDSSKVEKTWLGAMKRLDEMYYYMNADEKGKTEHLRSMGIDPTAYQMELVNLSEFMKDEEKAVFNYLFNTDREKAEEYFEDIKPNLTRRSGKKAEERATKMAEDMPVTSSVLSVPMNVIGGLSGGLKKATDTIMGNETDVYDSAFTGNLIANTIRNKVGQDIAENTEDVKLFGTNVPSFLYQTGMSMGDTLLGASLFGKGYSVIAGSSAYQTKARELYEAGEDRDTIEKVAIASGTAEVLFEYMSLDKLMKTTSVVGKKQLIKSAFKQAGVEASEEFFTEVANILVDENGRGGNSELNQLRKRLKEQGYSDSEIEKNIKEQVARQLVEASVGGALSGGAMGGGMSFKNNAQYTKTEKQFISDTVQERAEAKEKETKKKLTTKERLAIQDDVVKELHEGEFSREELEKRFGGESYNEYQQLLKDNDEYNKLLKMKGLERTGEQDNLLNKYNKMNEEMSFSDRLAESRSKLAETVKNATGKSSMLDLSYGERGKRTQKFAVSEEQMNKYSEKEREIVQKAIDYGEMNNTRKAHEFVDLVAKLSADKGVSFDFTNNEKLKNSGFALEGKTINGFKNGNNITINLQSKNALNTVVGHEITHVLEGSKELYKALQDTVIEYAKQKGVYDSMYKDTVHLYRNQFQNETLQKRKQLYDSEITADLVGQYIFSDVDFVRNLSMKNRNVFQKVYDEIKYFLKTVTSGSDAERQLLKAKKIFEDVYRDTSKNTSEKTQLSMTNNDYQKAIEKGELKKAQKMVEKTAKENGYTIQGYHGTDEGGFTVFDAKYSDDGISLFVAKNKETAQSYTSNYSDAEIDLNSGEKQEGLYRLGVKIQNPYVIDAKGKNWNQLVNEKIKSRNYVRIDMIKENGEYKYLATIKEYGVKDKGRFYENGKVNSLIENETFDTVQDLVNALPSSMASSLKQSILKRITNSRNTNMRFYDTMSEVGKTKIEVLHDVIETNSNGERIGLRTTRDWSKYAKEHGHDGVIIKNVWDSGKSSKDVKAERGDIYIAFNSEQIKSLNAVTYDNEGNVIPLEQRFDESKKDIRFSLTDNKGRTLTKEQQEKFKDSKVRDENGNLLEVYHGSKFNGFNIFEYSPNRQTGTDYGKAYYFTSDYEKASGYAYDVEKDSRVQKYKEERRKLLDRYLETGDEADKQAFKNVKIEGKTLYELMDDESYSTGGEVKSVYLNLKNPLIVDAEGKYYYEVYEQYFKEARESGNDGIIVKNVIDNPRGKHRPIDVYIAFENNQIKNVDNTKPTDSSDIRFSLSNDIDNEYMSAIEKGDIYSAQKMVDKVARENGYTKRMFHETDAENIHIFDISKGTHGGNDSQTPYGIFTKSSDKNIGLGKKQMALYVKADKTLFVENRDEVSKKIPQLIPYYDQIAEIDKKYDVLAEEMEDVELGALEEWMEANPDVDMDIVYPNSYIIEGKPADIDDAKYQKAFKERQEIMAKWRSETDAISIKCKDIITKHLRDNGYDSMYFMVDGGSFGRQTDSLIVLDTNQVKSANLETYDDNGNVIPLSKRFKADNNDIRFSLSDNQGRKLSEAQQERFKDSKVRDENGQLIEVYHGSGAKFTEFSYDFIGMQGSAEGQGFYFTDSRIMAEGYSKNGNLLAGYLDIKKPLSDSEVTISKDEVKKLLKEIDPTGDNIISDYDSQYGMGYPSQSWYNRSINDAVNTIVDTSDSDSEIIAEISNVFGDIETVLKTTKKLFGYDGYIVKGKYDNASVYVAFESNQFKSVDNINPTDNPDINLSLSDNKPLAPKPNGIYAEDIALEKPIAPIKQGAVMQKPTVSKNVARKRNVQGMETLPIPQEHEVKGVKMNKKDANRGELRSWVETSTESDVVDFEILPEDLNESAIYYQPISNKKTLDTANADLDRMGYDKALQVFNAKMESRTLSLSDIALGERLVQESLKRGDKKTTSELIQDISILGTELGQKVQALSIIQRMTPEGQLKMLQKIVNRGKAKGDNTFKDVEITDKMVDDILGAYNEDGTYDQDKLNGAVESAKQQIADQMGVSKMDKVNAWRMLSMLGNPKTHIRNIFSNATMQATSEMKNALARTVETIAPIKNRTKTWKRASQDVKDFAEQSTKEAETILMGEHSYSEVADIKAKRDVFKTKILQKVYDFNSNMLTKEDAFFKRPVYRRSLQEFLTANGIKTQEDIQNNKKLVEKGKLYALEQSQIATFQQYSWLANKINEIERKNVATQIGVGSVLPFKKTPINIAKTGLSYSPLGFAKSLSYDLVQMKKGNMEASQVIDNLSKGATGSALTYIGYMLAMSGLLIGGGEDDKEGKYDYQLGKQSYSIKFGGNTYSLSWLTPVAMPLFVGANAYEMAKEGKDLTFDSTMDALAQTLDPMSEMSFLSSLDSVLTSYESGAGKFMGIFETAGQNYVTQFAPTLMSQIAQVTDDKKRSTQVSADSDARIIEQTINKLKYKIPLLRETLEPTIDIWGNEVKQSENMVQRAVETFIAPWSRKESIATEIDEEIKGLYSQTGDGGIIPSVPSNKVKYDGETYRMSAKEFTDYKKTYGRTANEMLEDLFRTTTYQNADSTTKAELIGKVYDYARDVSKKEYLEKEGVEYTNATENGVPVYKENKIKGAIDNDMMLEEFDLYTKSKGKYNISKLVGGYDSYKTYTKHLESLESDKKANGQSIPNSLKNKKFAYINSLNVPFETKMLLWKQQYPSDDRYNVQIIEYLNNRSDISYQDMVDILTELDFKVSADGTVRW